MECSIKVQVDCATCNTVDVPQDEHAPRKGQLTWSEYKIQKCKLKKTVNTIELTFKIVIYR